MSSQQIRFQLNDQVQFAAQQDAIYVITHLNIDGTFNIQRCLANQQVLSYEMVSQELLRRVS